MLELWFTEKWSKTTNFSIKVKEHLYSEKTTFQQIDFFLSEEYGKIFTLDGMIMITEKDEFIYHEMIAHVPMCVNLNIENILVIGGGDGGTVRELLKYRNVKEIHLIEIDERVVKLSQKYFPSIAESLNDKKVTVYFQDGMDFVNRCKDETYDLIIVDSTDPISIGEGLFTTDFYNNCYRILKKDGILVNQHESPYYDNYSREMKKVHEKLRKIFPICKVYQFHQPTYASGHWLFGFASKKYDPIVDSKEKEWNELKLETKYYNSDIQKATFALPNYVKELLK